MILMLKNTPVLSCIPEKNEYKVLNAELLPVQLRGVFGRAEKDTPIQSEWEAAQKKWTAVVSYLSKRALSLSRENAKKLLNAYQLSQSQDPFTKMKVALTCKAVSVIDDYWINDDELSYKWEDVNPRTNHLNEIVSHIMLSGSSLTLTGKPYTPELTGNGAYAKSWIREADGLYLYKRGSERNHNIESEIEISVSSILDCFNVPHVKYLPAQFEGVDVSKCKNMSTDAYCIVPAEDLFVYCNQTNQSFLQCALNIDAENIYKMCIVDYLISNSDRHMLNWGFYMNNDTGHLLCCHPLFDHNNAFDKTQMRELDGGGSLIFEGKSKRDCAFMAMKKCHFVNTKPVTRDMFLSDEMYRSFMERAESLGLYRQQKRTFKDLFRKSYEEYVPSNICSVKPITYTIDRLVKQDSKNTQTERSKAFQEEKKQISFAEPYEQLEQSDKESSFCCPEEIRDAEEMER